MMEPTRDTAGSTKPESDPNRAATRPETPPKTAKMPKQKAHDTVDEAGMDSFPASDPPAHWAGKDRPPLLNGEEPED